MKLTQLTILIVVGILLLTGCSSTESDKALKIENATLSRQIKLGNLIAQGCNDFNRKKFFESTYSFGSLARLDPKYADIAAAAYTVFLNDGQKNLARETLVLRYSGYVLLAGFCSTNAPIPLTK